MQAKAKYSREHKAATKLYAAELEKGEDGMSSRKVKSVIKKITMELVQAMQQFTTMWLRKARLARHLNTLANVEEKKRAWGQMKPK